MTIMLLGHWIELRSIAQASGALNQLAKLLPDMAWPTRSARRAVLPCVRCTRGVSVAMLTGHIVLLRSDPRDIPRVITLSRATYRKMIQNLWWAAGYNVIAIPLAAGVLSRWGILLTRALGAVLMSASTVIVALNAQLLRRAEL